MTNTSIKAFTSKISLSPIWKYIIKLFLLTRAITLVAATVAYYQLPFKWSFPYWDTVLVPFGHPILWSWGNFDGVHYLNLASSGYNFGLTQAFFPLYMLLIKALNLIIPNQLLVALTISHICYLLSLYILYQLLRLDYSQQISKRVLLLYAIFPTSFYFLSVYTESLFIFLLLTIFYLVRTNRWFIAGLLGIALTATRIVGIFIIPAMLYESLYMVKFKNLKIKFSLDLGQLDRLNLPEILTHCCQKLITFRFTLYSMMPAVGLLAYMAYLYIRFDDPLLFAHVQSQFGAGRETDKLILFYQVVWRYLKMIVTVDRTNPIYFTILLEFISALAAVTLLIWGFFKKIRPSYLIFSLGAIILPTLTGNFSSMPRYVLVAFPVFIMLATIKSKWINILYIPISIILLIITTAMFTRGYWIG